MHTVYAAVIFDLLTIYYHVKERKKLYALLAQDSEIAIRWAITNVYRHGDVFHLLHVIPEPKMVHVWVGE